MIRRPKLLIERIYDGELDWKIMPEEPPHLDPRILHAPEECDPCAAKLLLQAERRVYHTSNTGLMNRLWPCPMERARSLKEAYEYAINRPRKKI